MDNGKEYLYHYTNIETLALILQNHTFRFNSLNKMDDLQEFDLDQYLYSLCLSQEEDE